MRGAWLVHAPPPSVYTNRRMKPSLQAQKAVSEYVYGRLRGIADTTASGKGMGRREMTAQTTISRWKKGQG